MHILQIYAKLQSSRLGHQYEICGRRPSRETPLVHRA